MLHLVVLAIVVAEGWYSLRDIRVGSQCKEPCRPRARAVLEAAT